MVPAAKTKAIAMPLAPPITAPTAMNNPVRAAIRMPVRNVFIIHSQKHRM